MSEKMNINVFIPKNNSFFVATIATLLLFSAVLYAFPVVFLFLFSSILGNLLLGLGVAGVGYFDFRWGLGLAAIFVILYQAFSLSKSEGRLNKSETKVLEGFSSCNLGCVAPTEPNGNCKVTADGKKLSCPWECKYPDITSDYCSFDTDCSGCGPNVIFDNSSDNKIPDPIYGHCWDGTIKINDAGTNCPPHPDKNPDDDTACSSIYGCCPDGITGALGPNAYGCYKSGGGSEGKNTIPDNGGASNGGVSNGGASNGGVSNGGVSNGGSTKDLWSPQLKADFIKFENTYNPNFQFDLNIIQKQASPIEVEYLLKNNKWPWSDSVKAMYRDAIMRNSTISMDPGIALDLAQTIYNETAIKEMLSWNTKEGSFLLTGVTVGHTKGLPDNINNIVRCGLSSGGNAVMEKITNVGYDGINGSMTRNFALVSNADIPKLVPGFKFLKSECNPCVALDDPANYSCPFSLNVGDGGGVSAIWKNLWGLDGSSISDSGASSHSKKKEFPLLNELKNELNKASVVLNANVSGNSIVYKDAVLSPHALHNNESVESPYLNSNL